MQHETFPLQLGVNKLAGWSFPYHIYWILWFRPKGFSHVREEIQWCLHSSQKETLLSRKTEWVSLLESSLAFWILTLPHKHTILIRPALSNWYKWGSIRNLVSPITMDMLSWLLFYWLPRWPFYKRMNNNASLTVYYNWLQADENTRVTKI